MTKNKSRPRGLWKKGMLRKYIGIVQDMSKDIQPSGRTCREATWGTNFLHLRI